MMKKNSISFVNGTLCAVREIKDNVGSISSPIAANFSPVFALKSSCDVASDIIFFFWVFSQK